MLYVWCYVLILRCILWEKMLIHLCWVTFDIASKFWNVTAPGTIFVGWSLVADDSPGGPGGPGSPWGPGGPEVKKLY